jgi:hypothetical protein
MWLVAAPRGSTEGPEVPAPGPHPFAQLERLRYRNPATPDGASPPGLRALRAAPAAPLDPTPRSWPEAGMPASQGLLAARQPVSDHNSCGRPAHHGTTDDREVVGAGHKALRDDSGDSGAVDD